MRRGFVGLIRDSSVGRKVSCCDRRSPIMCPRSGRISLSEIQFDRDEKALLRALRLNAGWFIFPTPSRILNTNSRRLGDFQVPEPLWVSQCSERAHSSE